MVVVPKVDIPFKEGYESVSRLFKLFIDMNNGKLKQEHYLHKFTYFTYDQMQPFEKDKVYKAGRYYTVEIKTIVEEFKDLRNFKGLETDKLFLIDVSFSKLYYRPKGKLRSITPVYMSGDDFGTPRYLERLRENIVFRYLKSGINTSDDIDYVRNEVVDKIIPFPKLITIPFKGKRLNNGDCLLYHCRMLNVTFKDNEISKEVEKLIYSSGLGANTSNGFGYME